MKNNAITILAGPTASGKSAWAIEWAQAHHGVIINADAVQVYADLPILTARPTATDEAIVPHRLYGFLDPHTRFDAQQWVRAVITEIEHAWRSGQNPIVVGGTGLYLKALVTGFSPLPDVPDAIRADVRARAKTIGAAGLYAELQTRDPVMAARLRPTDTQRLSRALEVMIATGRSLADWQALPPVPPLPHAIFHKILIDRPRMILRDRARTRLDIMIQNGVLDEIRDFVRRQDQGLIPVHAGVTQALGFTALADHIRGRLGFDAACETVFIQTAQYIKRQQTWFRHQMMFDEVR